jgi:hypothetical protein
MLTLRVSSVRVASVAAQAIDEAGGRRMEAVEQLWHGHGWSRERAGLG